MANLKPLFDRVVVEVVEPPKETAHGIVLPESVTNKVAQNTGKVVATGPGKWADGEINPDGSMEKAWRPMTVKVGDTVLFSIAGGLPFKLGDKSYLIFDESSILAILEN